MSSDFSRDSVQGSSPDHGISEYHSPRSARPTLAGYNPLVRFRPTFYVFSHHVLTNLYPIQDSLFVPHGADGSRFPGLQRHHSAPSGRPPGRSSARDVFHSSPARNDASNIRQRGYDWESIVENPNPIHSPGSVQMGPPHDFAASASSWESEIYNPPAADGLVPHVGGFPPPIDTEYQSWALGVYTHDSHPNHVSREGIFPQNGGPLIQPGYQSDSVGLVFTTEHPQSNDTQLSRSGSQGASLIVSGDYVRSETLARWLCSTLDISQNSITQHSTHGGGSHDIDLHPSLGRRMSLVPQRKYARTGDRDQYNSIYFKVNGRSGISVRDAIGKIYAGLEGRDNRVFVDKPSVIMLRLEVRPISDCEVFLMTDDSAVAWVHSLVSESQITLSLAISTPINIDHLSISDPTQ